MTRLQSVLTTVSQSERFCAAPAAPRSTRRSETPLAALRRKYAAFLPTGRAGYGESNRYDAACVTERPAAHAEAIR